jgi:predicted protein tyrosine phosphatase
MERKKFDVRSFWNAQIFRSDRPWAAISINTTDDDFADLSEENRRGLLRLVFADTADPNRDDAFNPALAQELLEFVERMWDEVEVFLIHCEAGLSRSPGVASALAKIYYDDESLWQTYCFPNQLVYRLLLEGNDKSSGS